MSWPEIKLTLVLSLAFVLVTVIGTLSHEAGHWTAARLLGCKAEIHYAHMNSSCRPDRLRYAELWRENREAILAERDFPDRKEFEEEKQRLADWEEAHKTDRLQILAGGPLQTMLFGTIGWLLLIRSRRKHPYERLSIFQWGWVLLALFWSRELFNAISGVIRTLLSPSTIHLNGDELRMAGILNWPSWSLAAVCAGLSLGIMLHICLVLIPRKQLVSLLVAALLGCSLGFYGWIYEMGPRILP